MPSTRREFLRQLGAAGALTSLARVPQSASLTPFPYVDGLSFMGPPEDIAASGLSAFTLDVSSIDPNGRSFDACMKSIVATRETLISAKGGNAFLALKGSDVREAHRTGRTAVFFQFQGSDPIGTELGRLETFHAQGLRVLQITYNTNNAWGGGYIERESIGLTRTGVEGIERMNALGIIPDLSHVADPTSRDVLKVSKKPVIVSHGAARAIVNNARCTPDDVIKGIANSGGAVGVFMMSFWLTTDAVPTVDSYLRQLRHIINVGGIEAVAIANDYDVGGEANARKLGNNNGEAVAAYYPWWDFVAQQGVLGFGKRPTHVVIPELNNPQRAFRIHEALDRAGYRAADIEKILGGNWIRVLTETLG